MLLSVLATACFVASASAHATFQDLWVNGVDQGDCCVRLPVNNNPITSVSTSDIACNANAQPAPSVCTVPAGSTVTVEMHQQPGSRSCSNEAIGGDHWGPVQVYLAKVSDATTAVGSSQSWFKIGEMGLPSSNPDYWATEVLNDNCGHFTVTIPSDIASGNYLLRAEVIALHVASSSGGAQFYVSCYQINVTGGGSASPPTVKFPGAYSASDPGILINIYTQLNSYVIPGPQPYGTTSPTVATTAWPSKATWNTAGQPVAVPSVCPGGGAPPPSSSVGITSAKPTSTSTSTVKPGSTSTSSKPSSSSSSTHTTTSSTGGGGTVAHYGQCGGQGWTGATVCQAPYTCQASGAYYSQCL